MKALIDTCFFVDLERENPAAKAFLARHPDLELVLCEIVRGELLAGGRDIRAIELHIAPTVAPITRDTAEEWARNIRILRAEGQLIGVNDLWIAATALSHGLPLVTRNAREFERIPNLNVLAY